MRICLLLPLLIAPLAAALPAQAQVSVNPRALDALPPAKPAVIANQPQIPAKPADKAQAAAAPAKPAAPTAPNVAAAPPANVALPPPIVVPTRPAPPVPPPKLVPDAPTRVEALKSGLRVVFGTGRSDINPATETAIQTLVHGGPGQLPAPADASYTITSYAVGTAEDPSSPRRLSLSRALAIRSLLITQGVASVRIYVRAFGPASPGFADGPADRGDVIVAPNPVTPTIPAPNKS